MSDHYAPPPPYEFSLQHDRKVTDAEVQALEASKASPFGDEEIRRSKHSKTLADKALGDVATRIHTFPGIPPKHRSDGTSGRTPRPLPPNPTGTLPLRYPPGADLKLTAETRKHAAQVDHAKKPRAPELPSLVERGPPLDDLSYPQKTSRRSGSVNPHPSQLPYDTPHQHRDGRWPISASSSIDPRAETSSRRPSHEPSHSVMFSLPQNKNGGQLPFDPSVAYSTFQAPRGAPASLYSSAISSQLYPDSAVTSGSRQPHVPARLVTSRLEKADVRSVRSHPNPSSTHPPSPTMTSYTSRSSGYERRWAASLDDIKKEIYRV